MAVPRLTGAASRHMMYKLLGLFSLSLCCSVPVFPQIDPSTYERGLISRGDNKPDFDTEDRGIKTLIVSLHLGVSPEAFQATYSCSPGKYLEQIRFLMGKNYVHEKGGRFYPSCMVVTDREGKDLFRYAEPLSQDIADAIVDNLDAIEGQYLETDLCKTTAFPKVAFLVLSNILLDSGQISNVEREFLAKERPLRHGKNYYFALLQNTNSSRESFGIYGNAVLSKGAAVYGNNRKSLSASQIQKQSEAGLVLSRNDFAVFTGIASFFQPVLIDLLKNRRGYIDEVYEKTGYGNEVAFEEFFIWWYHFIYTRATDILAEKGCLVVPADGNVFYRLGSVSAP